ncbi:MAG: glycosyltransferase family 2 protein [Solirubrobacteraceae bacterium]
MNRVSIVVPSYRRPERLMRCLAALARQRRPVDDILVVCRAHDAETGAVAERTPAVRRVDVELPGVLAAMRAGARAARGDCIGFVDDDTEAHEGWLEGIVAHLADPTVGGVGGRDVVGPQPDATSTSDVGRITAFGKLVGNHHLGVGPARDVDVLKGANMVFRRSALALPGGLRGDGAEVHFEVATSLWAASQGWRLVYDPAVVVDHLAGPRFDDDARGAQSARATANAAFNLVLCLGSLRPDLRRRRFIYGLVTGDRAAPGLLRAARAALDRDRPAVARLLPSLEGQLAAHLALSRDPCALRMYGYPSPGVEARRLVCATPPPALKR